MKLKIKNWTIEFTKNNGINAAWLDDGWNSQHVVFYGKNKWGADFPERIPKYVKAILNGLTFNDKKQ